MKDPLELLLGDPWLLQGEDPVDYSSGGGDSPGDVIPPDDTTGPPDPFGSLGDIEASQTFSVPGDIAASIDQVAAAYRVPAQILAAVLYYHTKWRKTGASAISLAMMAQAAQLLAANYTHTLSQLERSRTPEGRGGAQMIDTTARQDAWFTVAANITGAPVQTFRNMLKNTPKVGGEVGFGGGGGGAGARIIPGLSLDQDAAAHAIADTLYIQYLGRYPTDEEYRNIIKQGLTPTTLQDWLRRQPYNGTSLGKWDDARKIADAAAQKFLGRDADPGEINFMIQNGIPLNADNIGAFYEQVKDHTVWGANPTRYRAMRTRIATLMQSYGINVTEEEVSNDLINRALTGKWTDDQINAQLKTMQQPGALPGVTVGQYDTAKNLANSIYRKYFGQDIPPDLVQQTIGMGPDQVMAFIRNLPSRDNPSIPVGVYTDMRDAAQQILDRLGFVGMTVKPSDVAYFASQKMNAGAIEQYFRTSPELIAQQPGLPYNMTREDYFKTRTEIERDYGASFGAPADLGQVEAAQATAQGAAPPEQDWLAEIMKEGISPQEAKQNFQQYFHNLGRPPTLGEVKTFRSKSDKTFKGSTGAPSISASPVGPVAAGLAGPARR